MNWILSNYFQKHHSVEWDSYLLNDGLDSPMKGQVRRLRPVSLVELPIRNFYRAEKVSTALARSGGYMEAASDHGLRDADLVEKVLIGDQTAKNTLVRRFSPFIQSRVKRLVVQKKTRLYETRDFVQEIWVSLFFDNSKILKKYDAGRGLSLESYLNMVIKREVGNRLQKERAIKRGLGLTIDLEEDNDPPIENGTPEQYLEALELASRLDRQMQRILPDKGMDVLHESLQKGGDASAIARELNVSVQVVYNWLHKIRLLCRELL